MNKKHKTLGVIFVLMLFLICFAVSDLWASSNWLVVNKFEYRTQKVEQSLTLVVLSDLHDREFGQENMILVEKVQGENPDLIFLLGDFINKDSKNPEITFSIIEKLTKIAPVYFGWGNHELEYMDTMHAELLQKLEASGAKVLDKNYVDITIDGVDIRIGGLYDYAFRLKGLTDDMNREMENYMREYEDTSRLKIMMSHRPDSFIFHGASALWDVDLVLSGHNHGGQVVFPVLGGVYGGDQGYFPEYVHGMYEKDKIHIFVSSGLGSNKNKVPRVNNYPEIAVIEIVASDEQE